ncbi:DUF5060 domain-containing protein [Devosia algicola]|uniref:DUF5060 domain-containing protein n=1 Tax=Devosia algicola TaxID=3026418 RepID=A0ABY7YQ91_9HYPH|nr:DUF5060 domain-containing protein [Devosia algicola]WDR03485.1 DUF5060 domain-containing protein [Devosia algicola]
MPLVYSPDNTPEVRTWQPFELGFKSERTYENAYIEEEFWIDLKGPNFSKRVYGFWNGKQDFVVRLTAPSAGAWTWRSGAKSNDTGLANKSGSFEAVAWSEAELAENPNRRGIVRAGKNPHSLEYADGTPFFLVGDTWWSVPTFRFPLPDGTSGDELGPQSTIVDYVQFRKDQGFNSVALITAMPCWDNDGHANNLFDEDGACVRNAWALPSGSAMPMHNEGGRPFEFPGKVPGFEDVVPDYDRVNPQFFKILDQKMDILFDMGFVPFVEVARRDTGPMWQKHHDWPESYARFVQYIFARYQAHNTILSPIHFDFYEKTIPSRDYNEPCNLVVDRWGKPPFGTLLSANPGPSTLVNFGGPEECRWLDMHQIGNSREHYAYWYLTEQFNAEPKLPALNGEPYYSGLDALGVSYPYGKPGNTPEDDMYVRSGMYGSLLSGGFAGYIYGCEGVWQSSVEPDSKVKMWDAFKWSSAQTVKHLRSFAMVRGNDFCNLIPNAEHLVPNRNGEPMGYEGWSYAAGNAEKSWFLVYFEANCADHIVMRGLKRQHAKYKATWFDPRTGEWRKESVELQVPASALLELPERPDNTLDWGLMLELIV